MSKEIVFFTFMFTFATVLSFLMAGQSAFVTTSLTSPMSATATTITVGSTAGFLTADVLWIGNEMVGYTGVSGTTFTGVSRGIRDTEAVTHPTDSRVYSESAGVINQLVGFNVLKSLSEDNFAKGLFTMVVSLPGLLINIVVKLVAWDFPMLEGHGAWLKYFFLYPLSAGLVFSFVQLVFRRGT